MTVLAPNGQPTKNRCVAFQCGVEVPIPRQFCERHHANVPKHLRQAIAGETKWLSRRGLPGDQHTLALISIAASRELQHRIQVDPKAARAFEEFAKAQQFAQQAQKAGLLGADGKPVPVAPMPAVKGL